MRAVKSLLASSGIHWDLLPSAELDPSLIYSRRDGRWETRTHSEHSLSWRRDVMHEFFEFLFWRCFHGIKCWPEIAKNWKCDRPHEKADEFAYQVLMPCREVQRQAKHCRFNLWALTTHFGVTKNLCFRAVTQYVHFPFPFFHVLLSFNAQPDQCFMTFEEGYSQAVVRGKSYKTPKNEALGLNWENLAPEQLQRWLPLCDLAEFQSKGKGVEVPPDDVAAIARSRAQMVVTSTDRLAGFRLAAPVDVIARPSATNCSQVYLQAVPRGYAELLLSGGRDLLRVAAPKLGSQKATAGDEMWAYDV